MNGPIPARSPACVTGLADHHFTAAAGLGELLRGCSLRPTFSTSRFAGLVLWAFWSF